MRPPVSRLVLLTTAALLCAACAPAWAAASRSAIAAAGLEPIDPPVAAPAFELPSIDGATGTLADHAGRWVLLTFWATWCGPCRSELPSLQRLHESDNGPVVLAVAVGSPPDDVRAFVRAQGLTFPVLLDDRGQAGRAYRAQGVPLSYLIDPEGRAVGIAQGARDWSRAADALAALAGDEPVPGPADRAPPAPPAAPAAVALPDTLAPPTVEVTAPTAPPRVGDPFELAIAVRWTGSEEDYLLHPPRLALPAGLEQRSVAATTSSLDGHQAIRYGIELRASEPGPFELDELTLRFTARGHADAYHTRVAVPPFEVRPRGRVAVAVVGVAGIVAVVGLGWVAVRRQRA